MVIIELLHRFLFWLAHNTHSALLCHAMFHAVPHLVVVKELSVSLFLDVKLIYIMLLQLRMKANVFTSELYSVALFLIYEMVMTFLF